MSRAISQAVAPGGIPCSPTGSVGSEPRSSHPSALVSLIAALASLGGGFSPWTVPPALLLGGLGLFHAAPAAAQTPAAPASLSVSTSDAGLGISWTAPSGTLTGYDLHYTSAPTSGSGAVMNDATVQAGGAAAGWVATSSPPGSTSTFHDITGLTNGTEYRVRLRAKNAVGPGAWAFGTGTANIVLNWQAATYSAAEGRLSGALRLRGGPASVAVSGSLTYAPGATNPASLEDDLQSYPTNFSSSRSGQIPAATMATPANDTVNEEHETFTVTINAGTGYVVGTPSTITVTIADNDPPTAPSGLSLTAESGKLSASWRKPVGPVTGYQLRYKETAAADQAASTPNDPSTGWVTSTSSITTTSQEITGLTNGTGYDVQVRATDGQTQTGNGYGAWTASQSGTPFPILKWPTATIEADESDPGQQLRLNSGSVGSALSGTLTYAAGTDKPASLEDDLTTGYATTFSSAAGAVPTITMATPVNDTVNEEHETFTVTLNAGTGYVVGSPSTITVTIKDNDPPAAPSGLSLTAGSGKLSASWTKPAGPVTGYELRHKTTSASNQAASTPGDPSTGWVTSTASITTTSAEITGLANGTAYHVQVRATDGQAEGEQTGNGYGAWTASQSGTPSAPTVMLSASPNPVEEGRPVTVTASLSEALSSSVTIPVTISTSSPNTAEPEDVGTLTAITIASGATSGTGTIATNQDDDTADETFTVELGTLPAEVTAGSPSSVEIRISDDDRATAPPSPPPPEEPPPLVVSISGGEAITEGGEARFTLSATPAPAPGTSLSVSVSVSQRGDVASASQTGPRTVVVDESGTASFSVSTEDDAIDEPDGAVTATVGTGNGYTPHASENVAAVTVRDNDLPVVTIEAVEESISEGGAARFSLSATPAPATGTSLSVRVRVSQRGDVASASQTGPRTVVVDDSGSASFSVSTEDDALHEEDGAITAVVEQGSGYIPHASSNSAAVTVRDNDLAPPTAEQRAWLLRFGRTVSQQVVDALQQRFSSSAQPGLELNLAGESLTSATPLEENHVLLSRLLGFEKVSSQELAQGSSFNFSGDGAGPRLSFWGSGALSSFNGSEDTFNLRGEVTTALLGAEWSSERWRAGAALSHSRGSGSYQGGRGAGDVSGALTGLFPYGRYALTPRLGIWATAGYGWGSLSHNPDGYALEYNPVATMSMGALGMEGLLLEGGSDGVTLTTTADLLVLQTSSQEVEGLPTSDGNLSRFRLGLEATRPFLLSNGSSLSPSLELGIRQDRGDAETGFGMDLGAAVTWSAPERGVSAVVKGRTLLSHGAEHFQEKGLALSFSWQPTPTNRGASLSVSHAVGGAAEGGMASLLNPTAIEVLESSPSDGERFEARLAYGFPFYNDRLTITPSVAAALSPSSRSYSLLWSVAPYGEQLLGEPWELSLEGERQEHSSSPVDHSLKLLFSLPL